MCAPATCKNPLCAKLTTSQPGNVQVALGIVLACSEELLGLRDMEAMVDLLRFGVPQWPHERLQARPQTQRLTWRCSA